VNQSNRIFAFLAAAFVIFITMRGELRTYYGFIIGCGTPAPDQPPTQTGGAPTPTQTGSNSSGISPSEIGQVADLALMFA
jgi:hypothetical protein